MVWYNGSAVNPIFQAAGMAWCHGEAFSARLAAQHLEGPAQMAGEEYGYVGELCSYARTHLGLCGADPEARAGPSNGTGVVGLPEQEELASRLPTPGPVRQRLRRLQHRPAVGRHLVPGVRQGRTDLQRLDALHVEQPPGRGLHASARSGSGRRATSPTSCTS